jgi:hypothetical protein
MLNATSNRLFSGLNFSKPKCDPPTPEDHLLSPASLKRKIESERFSDLNARLKRYFQLVREKYPDEVEKVETRLKKELSAEKVYLF